MESAGLSSELAGLEPTFETNMLSFPFPNVYTFWVQTSDISFGQNVEVITLYAHIYSIWFSMTKTLYS